MKDSRRKQWPVAMAAELLGKSRRQLYYDIAAGKLRVDRQGPRKIVIPRQELLRYLENWN